MKNKTWLPPFGFLLVLVVFSACIPESEDRDFPQISTNAITEITQTSAKSGGLVTSDGNAEVAERGVCWNIGSFPVSTDSHTNDGTGTGSFSSTLTGLSPNTNYYVRAYATNAVGTSYGEVQSFKTGTGGGSNDTTVTDLDGNVYRTVKIGGQIWMAENLKVTRYRQGDAIPYVSDAAAWSTLKTGGYCNYENLQSNADAYGRLYNWAAVTDKRNIAPAGWHVASYGEWETLMNFLGGNSVAGGKLKEKGNLYWNSPNNSTDDFGFKARGSGLRDQLGKYFAKGFTGYCWTSTEGDLVYAWGYVMSYNETTLTHVVYEKPLGFPVRCVKD